MAGKKWENHKRRTAKIHLAAGILGAAVTTGCIAGCAPSPLREEPQTIVYERADIHTYDNGWPYIHDVITNQTDKTIVGTWYYMLAFDADGLYMTKK